MILLSKVFTRMLYTRSASNHIYKEQRICTVSCERTIHDKIEHLVRSINPTLVVRPKNSSNSNRSLRNLPKVPPRRSTRPSPRIHILQERRVRIRSSRHSSPPNRRNNIAHLAILVLHPSQVPPRPSKIHNAFEAGHGGEDVGVVEDVPAGGVSGGFADVGGDVAFADDGDDATNQAEARPKMKPVAPTMLQGL